MILRPFLGIRPTLNVCPEQTNQQMKGKNTSEINRKSSLGGHSLDQRCWIGILYDLNFLLFSFFKNLLFLPTQLTLLLQLFSPCDFHLFVFENQYRSSKFLLYTTMDFLSLKISFVVLFLFYTIQRTFCQKIKMS